MKISRFENEETWLDFRKGKVMGTRSGGIIPNSRNGEWKKGFWEIVAEKLAEDPDGQNPMERGKELESEAVARLEAETGLKLDNGLVVWSREDNENIAISPDAYTADFKIACEVKCLNTASHVEALVTQKIPSEYVDQAIQYFVVNDDLEKLYFTFYDPRIQCKDFFYIEMTREELQDKIDTRLDQEKTAIAEINRIVNELSF